MSQLSSVESRVTMAHPQQLPTFPFDDLYCSEDPFDQQDHHDPHSDSDPTWLEQDMSWDHHELTSLLSKQSVNPLIHALRIDPSLRSRRDEAVDWILKSRAHHGFSPLTAVLAVDYFDRFVAEFGLQRDGDEPWTAQLTAVACLSIAAKVEEVHVPSLLDLQEEESEFYFKGKDVEKMEVMVLSALRWKMIPVTVVSFLDYIARRLQMEHHLCSVFLTRCDPIILAVISDMRYTGYTASVMATAISLHVLHILRPSLVEHYQTQLFNILDLDIQKENVEACRKLVMDCTAVGNHHGFGSHKRKFGLGSGSVPGSPNGVLDICYSPDSEGSRDYSWSASDESESKKMRLID